MSFPQSEELVNTKKNITIIDNVNKKNKCHFYCIIFLNLSSQNIFVEKVLWFDNEINSWNDFFLLLTFATGSQKK